VEFDARFGAAPSVCAWLTCTGLVASRCFGLVDDDGAGDSRTRHSRLYRCDWKGERIARGALFAFEAAVIALVVAFWTGAITVLPWAGTLIVLALACYLVPATSTLATAFAGPKTEAALERALLITLGSLLITAVIGAVLAWTLAGLGPPGLALIGGTADSWFVRPYRLANGARDGCFDADGAPD
jgi:hypothetical protein